MPRGNIVSRRAAFDAIRKEDKAVANRPGGWSAGEARRSHRRGNAKSLGKA